jgi:hypothetical protein
MTTLSAAWHETLALPPFWHLCGIVFVFLLMVARRLVLRSGVFLIFFWSFLPTLAHECSHYLMGRLCRARLQGFTLLPRSDNGKLVLGSVSFHNLNPLTAPLVALSPLLLLGAAYFLFCYWTTLFRASVSSTIGLYAMMYLLVYGAIPSTTDLKVAFNWKSVLLYGSVGYLVYLACHGIAR